jgi:hypothetical protein
LGFSPKALEIKFAPGNVLGYKSAYKGGFMPATDKTQEIRRLHETMYEQSLVFLALRTQPDGDAQIAETRDLIMRIYSEIQTLA